MNNEIPYLKTGRNVPLLSYLRRNVALLVLGAVAFVLFKWEALFREAGPIVYIPVLFVVAVIVATMVRHFFWRNTVDDYAKEGRFANDWTNELSPQERVRWTIGITLVLIFCASLIAAALAK